MNSSDEAIFIVSVGTVLVALLATFIILFVILYKRAQLKHKMERQDLERSLLKAEVETREQTMTDISRDLHDNFGQIASLVKMQLAMVSKKVGKEDREKLDECNELLAQLIHEIRNLSTSLNAKRLHQIGLYEMIEKDLERMSKLSPIKLELLSEPPSITVSEQTSVFLYRMFQEMMNNVLRHSEASKAWVNFEKKGTHLLLSVKDNGKGIPKILPERGAGEGGNGLVNIQERCKILGADCTIQSSSENGTFIAIKLPI